MKFPSTLALAIAFILAGASVAQDIKKDPDCASFLRSHGRDAEDTASIWWITEQFSNTERTWEALLSFHEQHVQIYPESKHRGAVEGRIAIIKRMLADKKPTESDRVEQLIYELREVRATQFVQPNDGLTILRKPIPTALVEREQDLPPQAKAIVSEMRRRIQSSRHAGQLLYEEIGFDCVPALIDHIDDDTLTRSVNYWRDFVYSHTVLTVGDCCRQILDKLVPSARVFDLEVDPEEAKIAMKRYYAARIAEIKKSGRTKP